MDHAYLRHIHSITLFVKIEFGVKSNFDVPLIAVHLTLHSFINFFFQNTYFYYLLESCQRLHRIASAVNYVATVTFLMN